MSKKIVNINENGPGTAAVDDGIDTEVLSYMCDRGCLHIGNADVSLLFHNGVGDGVWFAILTSLHAKITHDIKLVGIFEVVKDNTIGMYEHDCKRGPWEKTLEPGRYVVYRYVGDKPLLMLREYVCDDDGEIPEDDLALENGIMILEHHKL